MATSSWTNTAAAAKTSIGVEVIERLVAIAVSEVDCNKLAVFFRCYIVLSYS